MRILITGGAGFVGRHLTAALLESGHAVRVLDALVPQVHGEAPGNPLPAECEFYRGDVQNAALVREVLESVDAVIHLAAEVGVAQSQYEVARYVGANSLGTAVLLQEIVARRGQIRKLVVASSMTSYGEGCGHCPVHGVVEPGLRTLEQLSRRQWEPECPHCASPLTPAPTPETKRLAPTSVYAISKRDQEELCRVVGEAHGIPTVALRYFNIYGRGQSLRNPYTGIVCIFASRLLAGQRATIYEDGGQSRDFVHVSDIVQANVLALQASEADGQVFNVSSGELWSVGQVAGMVATELGVEGRLDISGQYRSGDIRHCHADISHIRSRLGFEPKVGLAEGLPDVVRWARQEVQSAPDATESGAGESARAELAAFGLVR